MWWRFVTGDNSRFPKRRLFHWVTLQIVFKTIAAQPGELVVRNPLWFCKKQTVHTNSCEASLQLASVAIRVAATSAFAWLVYTHKASVFDNNLTRAFFYLHVNISNTHAPGGNPMTSKSSTTLIMLLLLMCAYLPKQCRYSLVMVRCYRVSM